ncbi:MAG: hypothetical protein PGN11_04045 [Quadrisphaera sp.]
MAELKQDTFEFIKNFHQYILGVFGVALLLAASLYVTDATFRLMLSSIGTSLFTASVVSETWKRLGGKGERKRLDMLIRTAVSEQFFTQKSRSSGVIDAHMFSLTALPIDDMIDRSKTIYLTFLYEPYWTTAESISLLKGFLQKSKRHRLFVFLPDLDNRALMAILAQRHGFSGDKGAEFEERVASTKKILLRNFSERAEQFKLGVIGAAGPSYSSYLFDSRLHGQSKSGPKDAGNLYQRGIQRLYRHQMNEEDQMQTLLLTSGDYWNRLKDDVDKLVSRLDIDLRQEPAPAGKRALS